MTRRTSKVERSVTPPSVKSVGVREFMRGGIYTLDEPTVVMSHSDELGTWYPRGQGVTANYYSSTTSPTNTVMAASAPTVTGISPIPELAGLQASIDQIKDILSSQKAKTGEDKTNG